MDKELVKAFTARVTQASRSELVVIMYEVILADIDSARVHHEKGDIASFTKDIKHAQKFLNELMATLDFQYELSFRLMSLYIFTNKALVTAMFKKSLDKLKEAETVLCNLLTGFEGVSKEDKTGPVMKNTQQIYAGLTYGRGVLNETYIDPQDYNRGFKA